MDTVVTSKCIERSHGTASRIEGLRKWTDAIWEEDVAGRFLRARVCCVVYYVILFMCVNFYREGCITWRNVDVAARDLEGLSTWHHVGSGWRLPNEEDRN